MNSKKLRKWYLEILEEATKDELIEMILNDTSDQIIQEIYANINGVKIKGGII